MKKVPKILFDMDQILVNMVPGWLSQYNDLVNESVKAVDIVEYDVAKFVKYPKVLNLLLEQPNFFYDMKPVPGIEYVDRIIREGLADVRVATQPPRESSFAIKDKRRWLEKFVPSLDTTNVHFSHRKDDLAADYLVDDAPKHLLSWKKTNPEGKLVTIDYTYNQHVNVDMRFNYNTAMEDIYKMLINR